MQPALLPRTIRGRVDRDDRLVAADAALEALHLRSGGVAGGALTLPQLVAAARLARRLGIVVSRGIVVADGDADVELWVRATPEPDAVTLAIDGWRETPPAAPAPAPALAREHDFLRASADWLWETDDGLRLTALSSTAAAATGDLAGRLLGQPLTRLFALIEDADGALPILIALARQAGFAGQLADLRESGERVRLTGTPLFGEDGRFRGFRGTVRAIDANEEAVPAEQPEGDAFGRQLDRALRAPLDRIVATAERLRLRADGPLRHDYADYAGDIAGAARHLLGLVDDLVDLHAIEHADFTPLAETIDLAEVARQAAGLLAVQAEANGVGIERPPPGITLPATGEFRRVLQILVNLVSNAVRYSPPGQAVRLEAARMGDRVAITVVDAGKGIAAADQARIFEKFERMDPSEPGGSGLGLYIARRLARAMGGDVTVASEPGRGARFRFTLPGSL